MEPGLATFEVPEMQVEECAGLGFGISWLLIGLLAQKVRAGESWPRELWVAETLVPLAAWATVGVFMMQVGVAGPARYLLPFYPLLIAPILTGQVGCNNLRKGWWRGAAFAVFGLAALLLMVSPARPLWPATTVLKAIGAENSGTRLLNRAWNVYSTYGTRASGFCSVIAELPPDADPLGFLAFDEPETGLWRPFGYRRIVHFCHDDTPETIRARGLQYALVSQRFLTENCRLNPDDWLKRMNAETLQKYNLKLLAGQEPHCWLLVRFK
jgi:hypothetical protein